MRQPKKKTLQKPWHKKPWGIALIVLSVITLTFPIVLFVLMWQSKKFPKWSKIAVTVFVAIIVIGAIGSEESRNQTDQSNKNAQTTEQKRAEEQKKKDAEAAYQKVLDTYAPVYCANHQDITVNEPTLQADGWPMADNRKGITADECKILIGLLYLQRDGYANRESWIKSVAERKVAIGMTKVEVVYAWGSPGDINKTITGGNTHEQWVFGNPIYGANYVYFDNDIVTSIQN